MKGILGRKIGMTQVFATDGKLIPVTVIEATPNVVLQKKTVETDGYNAIRLGSKTRENSLQTSQKKVWLLKQTQLLSASLKNFVLTK